MQPSHVKPSFRNLQLFCWRYVALWIRAWMALALNLFLQLSLVPMPETFVRCFQLKLAPTFLHEHSPLSCCEVVALRVFVGDLDGKSLKFDVWILWDGTMFFSWARDVQASSLSSLLIFLLRLTQTLCCPKERKDS